MKKEVILTISVVALALLFAVGTFFYQTSAKYVFGKSATGTLVTNEFYFESDLLAEDAPAYTVNYQTEAVDADNQTGASNPKSISSFTFVLKNYADNLRITEDDISYTVSVDSELSVTYESESTSGTAQNSNNTSAHTLNGKKKSEEKITVVGFEKGKTYTIAVTGKTLYTKTLKATITVYDDGAEVYQYVNTAQSAYVLLTVWTENVASGTTVTITYPTGLIPDNTYETMRDWTLEKKTYDVEVVAYSSYQFRFFKDSTYDASNGIVVMCNDETVPTKQL
jgi:hypothetical protein